MTRSQSIPRMNGNSEKEQLNGKSSGYRENGHAQNANGHTKQVKASNGSSMVQPAYDPAPRTQHYEFLGPPGALGISILVPLFTYFFAFGCDERGCPTMPVGSFLYQGFKQMQSWQFYADLWDTKAATAYLAWYAWCVVCWAILPGRWLEGTTLRNGEKLWYKINGARPFITALLAVLSLTGNSALFLQTLGHVTFRHRLPNLCRDNGCNGWCIPSIWP